MRIFMSGEAASAEKSGRIGAQTRLECKICWYVYDPDVGDEYWQIPAGTAFADLPEFWSCPDCDSKKQEFLVLDD